MSLERYNVTTGKIRTIIKGLLEEANGREAKAGLPLCRFAHPSIYAVPGEDRLACIPWLPQWSAPDSYGASEVPQEIEDAIEGLCVSIGRSSWVVYQAEQPVKRRAKHD